MNTLNRMTAREAIASFRTMSVSQAAEQRAKEEWLAEQKTLAGWDT